MNSGRGGIVGVSCLVAELEQACLAELYFVTVKMPQLRS